MDFFAFHANDEILALGQDCLVGMEKFIIRIMKYGDSNFNFIH